MKYAAILGAAGTGKSHELRERSKDNPMYACLTATTGIAAINLGAGVTTINSVLRYYNTESLKEALDEGDLMRSFITLARAGFEWLLIDEVSMMCADQITYICQAAEAAENHLRNQRMTDLTVPGLMVSGDFLQLPPVQGEFAFRSPFWHNFEKENSMTRLTHNYRQDNPVFQQALAFARHGNGVDCAMQLKKLSMEMNPKVDEDFEGVTLFPTNVCVDKMNKSRFDKLPGDVEQFAATRWGVLAQEWKQIPHVLDLKVDARVMVLTNDPGKFEYVNGDQAIVRYFTDTAVGLETDRGVHLELPYLRRTVLSKTKPANAKEFGGVRIEGATFHTLRECSTPREKAILLEASEGYAWNNFFDQTPYLDVRSGKWVVGEIAYMPLRLGYASTFHKVQGLTLDSVQIDARMNWAGNPAMMYVALSRCRTPEHVRIVTKGLGDLARRIVTSGEVMKWV